MAPIIAKVSVIIPVYNGANFILEAIDCVLKQTHKNVEIIIIDDCSTDDTLTVLTNIDTSITLLKLPYNQGASAARNMGLKHANGDFIAFLDADDLWSTYFIELMLAHLYLSPSHNFIYCLDHKIMMDAPTRLYKEKPANLETTNMSLVEIFKDPCMATAAILFKQDLLNHIGGFDCKLKTAEDIDFVLRVAEFTPILRLDAVLVEVRITEGSLGQAVSSYQDNINVIEQFLLRNPLFKKNKKREITETHEIIYYCWLRELLFRRNFSNFYQTSTLAIKIAPSARILKLVFKSIPVFIIHTLFKVKKSIK